MGFQSAVRQAADLLEVAFSDNITVNIAVGWGEIAGVEIPPGATVSEGQTAGLTAVNYGTLKNLLLNSASSTTDLSAYGNLAISQDPNGDGTVEVSRAQQKAMPVIGFLGVWSSAATRSSSVLSPASPGPAAT